MAAGLIGRTTKPPPQLGQTPFRTASAHVAQKVHSKVQMRASALSGDRSTSQHSQLGLRINIEGLMIVEATGATLSRRPFSRERSTSD